MKKILTRSLFLALVLIVIPTMVAFAQTPTPAPIDVLQLAMQLFVGLVGFPLALGGLLAIGMWAGLSADLASKVALYANLAMFAFIVYLVITGQSALVATIDASLSGLAKLLADIAVIIGAPVVTFILTGKSARAFAEVPTYFVASRKLLRGK